MKSLHTSFTTLLETVKWDLDSSIPVHFSVYLYTLVKRVVDDLTSLGPRGHKGDKGIDASIHSILSTWVANDPHKHNSLPTKRSLTKKGSLGFISVLFVGRCVMYGTYLTHELVILEVLDYTTNSSNTTTTVSPIEQFVPPYLRQ